MIDGYTNLEIEPEFEKLEIDECFCSESRNLEILMTKLPAEGIDLLDSFEMQADDPDELPIVEKSREKLIPIIDSTEIAD